MLFVIAKHALSKTNGKADAFSCFSAGVDFGLVRLGDRLGDGQPQAAAAALAGAGSVGAVKAFKEAAEITLWQLQALVAHFQQGAAAAAAF